MRETRWTPIAARAHAGRTLAHLDAKLNQWRAAYRQQSLGDGAQLGEQLQDSGLD